MDGLMGRYHIRAKSQDAMVRVFYHLIDMAITNAYILYRRMQAELYAEQCADSGNDDGVPIPEPKLFELPQFRERIAAGLVSFAAKRGVGRPRPETPRPETPVTTSKHLVEDLRYDGMDHTPMMVDKKMRRDCKLTGCKSKTQFMCKKCYLHLCITKDKNCFEAYHTRH